MCPPPPGRPSSTADFRRRLRAVDAALDCELALEDGAGPLGRPFRLGGRTLQNRFCVLPGEGGDGTAEGLPSERTLARWRAAGRGGAKLVWGVEPFAVEPAGRARPGALGLNDEVDARGGLARLFHALRAGHREAGWDADELCVGLQLAHAGRWARPEGAPAPRAALRNPALDARSGVGSDADVVGDGELEAIAERYVEAAEAAWQVGFDFVDVACCDGGLLHELLGARDRSGRYGGEFEARTRLFRAIVSGVRASCPELLLGVRLAVADAFPHAAGPDGVGAPAGWEEHVPYRAGFGVDADDPRRPDPAEPLRFLALCEELGVSLVAVALGAPAYTPHLARPGAAPPDASYAPPHDPLVDVARHLQAARRVKAARPALAVVGGGYSYLGERLPHVAQHEVRRGSVDLVGLGRTARAYPELPRDVLLAGALDAERARGAVPAARAAR